MKLIVHVTKDNLTMDDATSLYTRIRVLLSTNFPGEPSSSDVEPFLHINGQIVDKLTGSHNTGLPGPPGEI